MKFTVEHKSIKAAVTAAQMGCGAAGKTIPILGCLMIKAANNALAISGSDMDVWATGKCEAAVSGPGQAAVNAEALGALINSCPAGALVEFSLKGLTLTVTAGRIKATFVCMHPEDFPVFTPPDAPREVLDAKAALEFCTLAAEMDQGRPQMQGVSFQRNSAVGTNGQKLAVYPLPYDGVAATVPLQYIPSILKAIGDAGRLFLGETVWRVEAEGISMSGKLIGLEFPDFTRIIPQGDVWMQCDADALLAAVRTATLGRSRDVLLRVAGPDLVVEGYGWTMSAAESCEAAIGCDGTDGTAACFAADYLQELLGGMAGRVISFTAKDEDMAPQKITAAGFAGFTALAQKRFAPRMRAAA